VSSGEAPTLAARNSCDRATTSKSAFVASARSCPGRAYLLKRAKDLDASMGSLARNRSHANRRMRQSKEWRLLMPGAAEHAECDNSKSQSHRLPPSSK
jgi:ribosomal protein L32